MVNYECYRCGYTNINKTKIINHINRKLRCKPIISNINLDVCKEYIIDGLSYNEYLNLDKNPVNQCKVSHKSVESQSKVSQKSKDVNENKIFECQFCNKSYVHKQSLHKHLKICNEKKKDEEAKESMNKLVDLLNKQNNELKEQLEKQNKQIDELIKKAGINNSTITQNIQNNIKILAYKDTDVSKLTDKDILKCLNHSNMCVPHLIKMIHLDPEKPENHNIYISNLKNGYIMVYDGGKWDTFNRDEIINNMIDDKQGLIEERIENWIEEGKKYPAIMRKFERYLEKKENNVVIDKIKEEIKLMLFNNRKLIKSKEVN
tara:strand:+ start:217 stop:1170 length:954 start_codon:yes stop_codon:yes gene_type:complete